MRANQYSIAVSLDGDDLGIFDKMSGGMVNSEETKYPPGGMAPEVSLGGRVMTDNVTVSRLYDLNRDHLSIKHLMSRVGKGTVVVKKQPLDVDTNPFGEPIVYRGLLKSVKAPETDSESSSAALLEMEVSTAGTVG